MAPDAPSFVTALKEQVGESNLRAVARYERDGYEFFHLREDVETRYTEEDVDGIYEDLLLDTMRSDLLEERFHAGTHQGSALVFEEMMAFQFVREEFAGLFVSVDKDCSIDLNEFVEICHEYT